MVPIAFVYRDLVLRSTCARSRALIQLKFSTALLCSVIRRSHSALTFNQVWSSILRLTRLQESLFGFCLTRRRVAHSDYRQRCRSIEFLLHVALVTALLTRKFTTTVSNISLYVFSWQRYLFVDTQFRRLPARTDSLSGRNRLGFIRNCSCREQFYSVWQITEEERKCDKSGDFGLRSHIHGHVLYGLVTCLFRDEICKRSQLYLLASEL